MTNSNCENLIASGFITMNEHLLKTAYDLKKYFN